MLYAKSYIIKLFIYAYFFSYIYIQWQESLNPTQNLLRALKSHLKKLANGIYVNLCRIIEG